MRSRHYLPGRLSRSAAVACVVVSCVGSFVMEAPAGTIEIPAWAFVRGNGRIHADPSEYADAGPAVGSGEEEPWGWRLEYEVDYPVSGYYRLFLQYASTEARPIEVHFDTRNVNKISTGIGMDPDTGEPTLKSSGARWEMLLNHFGAPANLSYDRRKKAETGKHTILLISATPLRCKILGNFGATRVFGNPTIGMLGLGAEGYLGARAGDINAGYRLNVQVPAIQLALGYDRNSSEEEDDFYVQLGSCLHHKPHGRDEGVGTNPDILNIIHNHIHTLQCLR